MHDSLKAFRAFIKEGMRPGKAARRAFGGNDAEVQSLAEMAGLEFERSNTLAAFDAAYAAVRSCMQGQGGLCYDFYTRLGVEVVTLKGADGIVARALVAGKRFCQTYGDKHYVLDALLVALGYEQSYDWLEGRYFDVPARITVDLIFHGERELGGWYCEWFRPENVGYALKRGWTFWSNQFGCFPAEIEMVRRLDKKKVALDDVLEHINEGWLPLGEQHMQHRTPYRVIGRVVRKVTRLGVPHGKTPWIDGYRDVESLYRIVDDDVGPWHKYEYLEEAYL